MSKKTNNISTDLQGVSNLTIEAITGITDIVESLHYKIISLAGILGKPNQTKTTGITGLVYRNIRSITKLAGVGIDTLLKQLSNIIGEQDFSPAREAVLSALNGVLGDYLVKKKNPLAITMQFRQNGKPIDEQTLIQEVKKTNGKLAIIIHGLCMNDLQWNRQEHNHAELLAKDIGLTPVYVHYNTGLHISENGKNFTELIETISAKLPQRTKIFIIAHSMGGLVSRSAFHYGKIVGHLWINKLKKIVFLGTPHHGSPLEKGGNWIDIILDSNPYSAPFSRLGKIRSCGITDMRYGNITDEDWEGYDRFEPSGDNRISVPLPQKIKCYAIAATTVKESSKIGDNLIGDGLVTINSAFGEHKNTKYKLLFPKNHKWIARDMNHMDLLNNKEVYNKIKKWLR